MSEDTLAISNKSRTSSIIALNAVSALAQIGQFGLGTTLIPIAMETRKASADNIGFTSSVFWIGMLIGLLVAGKLTRILGYRNTVILGLIVSAISFALMPVINWHWWALPAFTIGFGMGLRWIANETWLYRLAPIEARGRIVGFHETLIAMAGIIAPLIIVAVGAINASAFWLAAGIMLTAIVPIFMAITLPAVEKNNEEQALTLPMTKIGFWLALGAIIAGCGGWIEGSLLALLPVYNSSIGLNSQDSAWLFTVFGVGAFALQFPIGWLCDKKGVVATAKIVGFLGGLAILLAIGFGTHLPALATAVFVIGGITGGLLTLGMIWSTLHNDGAAITNRVRQVSIVYTLLSAAGPFVSGFVVSQIGSQSLFWQQLVVIGVLGFVLFKQKNA
jgi:MFS family permease